MKVITVNQPWAHLIVYGGKVIENRTWKTDYRGPIAIHAGKTTDTDPRGWKLSEVGFESSKTTKFLPEMEFGKIIGIADLVNVIYPGDRYSQLSLAASKWFDGPYGLVLRNIHAVEPVAFEETSGMCDLPEEVEELLRVT